MTESKQEVSSSTISSHEIGEITLNSTTHAANIASDAFINNCLQSSDYRIGRCLIRGNLFGINIANQLVQHPESSFGEAILKVLADTFTSASLSFVFRSAAPAIEVTSLIGGNIPNDFYSKQLPELIEKELTNHSVEAQELIDDRIDLLYEIQSTHLLGLLCIAINEGRNLLVEKLLGIQYPSPFQHEKVSVHNITEQENSHEAEFVEISLSTPSIALLKNLTQSALISVSSIPIVPITPPEERQEIQQELKTIESEINKGFSLNQESCKQLNYSAENPPNEEIATHDKGLHFLQKYAPDLIRAAKSLAKMTLQLHHIAEEESKFERRKQITKRIEEQQQQHNLMFKIDTAAIKKYDFNQLHHYFCNRIQQNFYLQLSNQQKSYGELKITLQHLRDRIQNNLEYQQQVDHYIYKIKRSQSKVINEIQDFRYDKVMPTLATGFQLASALSVNIAANAVFFCASAITNIIASSQNQAAQKRLENFSRILENKNLQIQVLQSQQLQLYSDLNVMESLREQVIITNAQNGTAAETRTELGKYIDEIKSNVQRLDSEKEKLIANQHKIEGDLKVQEEKIEKYKKKIEKENKGHRRKEDRETDHQTSLNELLQNSISQKNNEIQLQQWNEKEKSYTALLEREERLAPLKDWNDARKKQEYDNYFKGMDPTQIKQKQHIMEMQEETKAQFQEFLNMRQEVDTAVHSLSSNVSSVLQQYSLIIGALGGARGKRVGHYLNTVNNLIQITTIGFDMYRTGEVIWFSINQLNILLKTISEIGGIFKDLNPLQLITQIANPALLILQLGAQVANVIGRMFGVDLFPDPTLSLIKSVQNIIETKINGLNEKIEQIRDKLRENGELVIKSLNKLQKFQNNVTPSLASITNLLNSNQIYIVLNRIQEIEIKTTETICSSSYQTTRFTSFKRLLDSLNVYAAQALDPNFTKIVYQKEGLTYLDEPLDAIQIVQQSIGFSKPLANYRILHLIINILCQKYEQFAETIPKDKPTSVFPKAETQIVKSNLATISQYLTHWRDFLAYLKTNRQWLSKSLLTIKDISNKLLAIYSEIKIEEFIVESDRTKVKDTIKEFNESRFSGWLNLLHDSSSGFKTKYCKQLDSNFVGEFRDPRNKLDYFLRYKLGHPNSTEIFQERYNNSYKGEEIKLSYIRHESLNPQVEFTYMKKNQLENYIHLIVSILNSGNVKNTPPRLQYTKNEEFFEGEGLLVFDCYNDLLPLFFPEELINCINQRSELKLLFEAEQLGLGIIIIDYNFEYDQNSSCYLLKLKYNFKETHSRTSCTIPSADVIIAAYDKETVHDFTNAKGVLSLNEFLISALYSDKLQSRLGLASQISCDLFQNDSTQSTGYTISISLPFPGLFSCLQKQPRFTFIYHHDNYNEITATALFKYVKKDKNSVFLDRFFSHEHHVNISPCFRAVEDILKRHKTLLWNEGKEKLSEFNKKSCIEGISNIYEQYEIIIACLQLQTGIDYNSACYLLFDHFKLPNPLLLKIFHDNCIEKFICILYVFSNIQTIPRERNNSSQKTCDPIAKLQSYLEPMENPLTATVAKQIDFLKNITDHLDNPDKKAENHESLFQPILSKDITQLRFESSIQDTRVAALNEVLVMYDTLASVDPRLIVDYSGDLTPVKKFKSPKLDSLAIYEHTPEVNLLCTTVFKHSQPKPHKFITELKKSESVEQLKAAFESISFNSEDKVAILLLPFYILPNWNILIAHIDYLTGNINILWLGDEKIVVPIVGEMIATLHQKIPMYVLSNNEIDNDKISSSLHIDTMTVNSSAILLMIVKALYENIQEKVTFEYITKLVNDKIKQIEFNWNELIDSKSIVDTLASKQMLTYIKECNSKVKHTINHSLISDELSSLSIDSLQQFYAYVFRSLLIEPTLNGHCPEDIQKLFNSFKETEKTPAITSRNAMCTRYNFFNQSLGKKEESLARLEQDEKPYSPS